MEENCVGTIQILPDEVISIVLQYNDIYDIIQFSSSCKRFNVLVKENKVLWKKKYRELIPNMLKTVEKHGNGDWLYELNEYYILKTIIYDGIFSINEDTQENDKNNGHKSTHEEYSVESLQKVILYAFTNAYSFFYTVHILQTAIKNGGEGTLRDLKDYHITYAKCCLRYLIHLFLAVKWVAGGKYIRNDLTPITVVNFFQQWVDPENLYLPETVQAEIQELANKMSLIIEDLYSSEGQTMELPKTKTEKILKQRRILKAISILIYEEMQIKVTGNGALKYMSIKNVSKNKIGNNAVVAAIYKTLASFFNVQCELIAFPNHLFIEWQDGSTTEYYTVNLSSGVLQPKRRCPFAQYSQKKKKYSYSPESLLLYMHSAYQRCNTNPMHPAFLLGLLRRDSHNHEPTRILISCLEDDEDMGVLFEELSMQYMSYKQRQLLFLLATGD